MAGQAARDSWALALAQARRTAAALLLCVLCSKGRTELRLRGALVCLQPRYSMKATGPPSLREFIKSIADVPDDEPVVRGRAERAAGCTGGPRSACLPATLTLRSLLARHS